MLDIAMQTLDEVTCVLCGLFVVHAYLCQLLYISITGPYVPGCADVMTEYSKKGSFFRLYYPTNYEKNIQDYKSQWKPWIPDDSYMNGFSRFTRFWLLLVRFTMWLISGRLQIPAIYGAKIRSNEKLKCIIFSHGLGGCRFAYSSICNELASQGFLVAALEHRDESASNSYYYASKEDAKNDNKSFVEYALVDLGNNHYNVRNSQVITRAEECKKVINLLHEINAGSIPYNILNDVPSEENKEFTLEDLIGLLDLKDIVMTGHSFGAATALVTLAENPKLSYGVILDIWMFPLKDMEELVNMIKQPLLFINTQTFHIASNIKLMEKFINMNPKERPCYTMLHTTHENQSDTVYTVGYMLNWFMKKLPPLKATKINNSIILTYLNKYINFPTNTDNAEKYLLVESHNLVTGIDKLKLLSAKYTSSR